MTVQSPEHKLHQRAHEAASFAFLPFVVDVFSRRELRLKRSELLAIERPEVLTLEVTEALQDIIPRGVLGFLCRAGGWRAQLWAARGQDQPTRGVRLIDPRVWEGRQPTLSYSASSVTTLLLTYNAVCQAAGQPYPDAPGKKKLHRDYPKQRALSFKRSGDLLVHHIAFLKVRQAPFKVEEEYWRFLTQDPLTQVARLATTAESAPEALARLTADDMGRLMPWLGGHLVECWRHELRTRWDTLERFHRLNTGLATWTEALLEHARAHERRDLLVSLLRLNAQLFDRPDVEQSWLREFNRLARDLRFADRADYQRMWARTLQLPLALHQHYQDARDVHPIDREAPDRVYMAAYEAAKPEAILDRARALVNQLSGVIS